MKVIADANDPVTSKRDTPAYPTVWYTYTDAYTGNGLTGLRVETWYRETAGQAGVRKTYEFYSGRGILMQSRAELTDSGSGT